MDLTEMITGILTGAKD